MLKLDTHEVKRIITMSELSPKLKDVIIDILKIKTSCNCDYARPDFQKLINDKTVIGLNIYKDYNKYIEVVYPKKEWVDTDKNYYSSEVCRISQNENNEWTADLYEYDLPVLRNKQTRHELERELTDLFNGDLSHTIDYQYEMIQEAISNWDYQDLEELVGDRDLAEFI